MEDNKTPKKEVEVKVEPQSLMKSLNLPEGNIVQATRNSMRVAMFKTYYERGFNDFVKDAMTKEDLEAYKKTAKPIERVIKYGVMGGIVAALVPSFVKPLSIAPFRFYIRWPIRLTLLIAPLTLAWYAYTPLRECSKTQTMLFDKYSNMDPKELEKKLPQVAREQAKLTAKIESMKEKLSKMEIMKSKPVPKVEPAKPESK